MEDLSLHVLDVAENSIRASAKLVEVRVTEDEAADFASAWSPDGDWIVFVSERDGATEIYVVRPDGSQPTRLTSDGAGNSNPRWLVVH